MSIVEEYKSKSTFKAQRGILIINPNNNQISSVSDIFSSNFIIGQFCEQLDMTISLLKIHEHEKECQYSNTFSHVHEPGNVKSGCHSGRQ